MKWIEMNSIRIQDWVIKLILLQWIDYANEVNNY